MWSWDLLIWRSIRADDFTSLFINRNDAAIRAQLGIVDLGGWRIIVDDICLESGPDSDGEDLVNMYVFIIIDAACVVDIIQVGNVNVILVNRFRVDIEISLAALAVVVNNFPIVDIDMLI